MDHDILQRILHVFSEENTKLKQEVENLKKQLTREKSKVDDKLLSEVFDKPLPVKTKTTPVPAPAPVTVPVPVPEKQDRSEYQKKYQAQYRAKKKAEKDNVSPQ
jgi:hypothetical protein